MQLRTVEFQQLLQRVEVALENHEGIRIEEERLIISPIVDQKNDEQSDRLKQLVAERIPEVELSEILLEVDPIQRAFHTCRQQQTTTTPTVEALVCLNLVTRMQYEPDSNGLVFGVAARETGLVHKLVHSRGNVKIRQHQHRKLSASSALEPILGHWNVVFFRLTALSGLWKSP